MKLEDLKIFLTVVEEGSISKAAIILSMTQPGVTQHIQSLEDLIGKKLFNRTGNRIEINEIGKLFASQAKDLLIHSQKVQNFGKDVVVQDGSLRIGVTDSSTLTVVPKALKLFKQKYPNVHIRLDVDDSLNIEYGVVRGHYDLGIITGGFRPHPSVEEEVLYCDRVDALVSINHPLAKKKSLSIEELAKWPILVYPRHSRTRKIIDEQFRNNKISPKEIIDVYFNTAAVKLAEIGIGVALLSKAFITSEMLKHKCAHLRIQKDPFLRTICLTTKQGAHLSDTTNAFYQILKQQKSCNI